MRLPGDQSNCTYQSFCPGKSSLTVGKQSGSGQTTPVSSTVLSLHESVYTPPLSIRTWRNAVAYVHLSGNLTCPHPRLARHDSLDTHHSLRPRDSLMLFPTDPQTRASKSHKPYSTQGGVQKFTSCTPLRAEKMARPIELSRSYQTLRLKGLYAGSTFFQPPLSLLSVCISCQQIHLRLSIDS